MARNRRRRVAPRGTGNPKLIAFQIIALVIALIAVLALSSRFSSGTSSLLDYLSGDDLSVSDHRTQGDRESTLPPESEAEGRSDPHKEE